MQVRNGGLVFAWLKPSVRAFIGKKIREVFFNMKKQFKLLATLLCCIVTFATVACGKASDVEYSITVDLSAYEFESETVTLLDYMNKLVEDGKMTFTTSGSGEMILITAINGQKQTTKSYWMLYTNDDTEGVAGTEYGSYEYEGQTLGMANFGAASLNVKDGCVYVWVYQTY